jgi:hypothetical protein
MLVYEGAPAMLGLELTDAGWVHHMVDPARVRAKGSLAQCETMIRVKPLVEVLGVLDLTCPECEAYWVAEFARRLAWHRVYSSP